MFHRELCETYLNIWPVFIYNVVVHRVDHVIEWITFPDPTTSKLKLLNHNTLN
jgi:hypothetical protein